MAKRFTIEILMNLAKAIGANPSKFMGTRTNISFLGKGPTKNPLFQSPLQGIDEVALKKLGPGMIGAVEDAMAYVTAGKLNSIQMELLGKNLLSIRNVMHPPVLPSASVTNIAPGIEGLKRFPRETQKFFGRPLKGKDFSEIDQMMIEGKIPDARGRTWNFGTPKSGAGELKAILDTKTGMSRAIARQLLLQDTRLKLPEEVLISLRTGSKGADPIDLMAKYYGETGMAAYDDFLNKTQQYGIEYKSMKEAAADVLSSVELLPKLAEGGLAHILQVPRRGRVVHPGGYRGGKK